MKQSPDLFGNRIGMGAEKQVDDVLLIGIEL
jgi:hypothetical protein